MGYSNSSLDLDDWYLILKPDIYIEDTFSILVWVWPKNFTNNARILDFGNGENQDNVIFSYSWQSTGKPFISFVSQLNDSSIMISPVPILTKAWTHLAVTFDGVTLKLFINGYFTTDWNPNTIPQKIKRNFCYFGFSDFPSTEPAYMKLDQIKFYNRALNSNEVFDDTKAKWI